MRFSIHICLVWAIGGFLTMFAQGDVCNGSRFNETEGYITTPGYPNRLDFNTCQYHINVGSGRIALTFINVSLPDGAYIVFFSNALFVGEERIQSRVFYIDSHQTPLFVFTPREKNNGSFKGVKLHYKQVSEGTCNFKYKSFVGTEQGIQNPGYPKNYEANSNCEFHIVASAKDNVVHISFQELQIGAGDVFAIYDATDHSVIYGPTVGPLKGIETVPTASSVKIIVNASSSVSIERLYVFTFTELLNGTCLKDHYGNKRFEQHVSAAKTHCQHAVRSPLNGWLRMWFESITIFPGDYVFVAQKDYSGKTRMSWNLTSDDPKRVRNFDVVEASDWFDVQQTANVSFDLRFMSYRINTCPFYKVADEYGRSLNVPSSSGNLSPNSSCELYFKAKDNTIVIHLRFSELLLSSGDDVTIYDPSDNSIIVKYNETKNLLSSVTSSGDSVRVVFTSSSSPVTVGRHLKLVYQTLSPDKCLMEYGGKSGAFSSVNRECEFNIYYSNKPIELTFNNIYVPPNNTIDISQRHTFITKFKSLGIIRSDDSGKTKYFRDIVRSDYNIITFHTRTANVQFRLSFKPLVSDQTVYLNRTSGTLLSPYYPEPYLRGLKRVYHVIVPNGHVMLNFTEMRLSGGSYINDMVLIYDGNTTSESAEIGRFEGESQAVLPAWFLGSSNNVTVKFRSGESLAPKKTYRFKAMYTMNTQVKYCDALKWSNAHPERVKTLPGRTTKYFCNKDYLNPDYNNYKKWVARKCGLSGRWEQGANLTCKRICPKIDEKLKVNTLKWTYSASFYYSPVPFAGTFVRFDCGNYQWELNGTEMITCTSRGNYSAAPPTCKKRPEREGSGSSSNNAWKYGVGIGGASLIITIVFAVLRVCFGFFTCCDSISTSSTLPLDTLGGEKLT